jgi:hypothetical protein
MQKFTQHSAKFDKDYHMLVGLNRKIKLPQEYEIEKLMSFKLSLQERVMSLWNEHQSTSLSKAFDMERLLQILECLAEDELFFENEIELEVIERILS